MNKQTECKECKGAGYYSEHDPLDTRPEHYENGDCISCPVQVQCEPCLGTGNQEQTIEEKETLLNRQISAFCKTSKSFYPDDLVLGIETAKNLFSNILEVELRKEIQQARQERDREIVEMIKELDTEKPSYESDMYDSGLFDMQKSVIKAINQESHE